MPTNTFFLSTAVGRDGVGHAEDSREQLERDAAVENPKRISDNGAAQGKQSLHRRLLERQHDPSDRGDKSDEQVQRVEKFSTL